MSKQELFTNNDLDTPMGENTSVNSEPDMSKSQGEPKPDMKKGYSKGELHSGSSDSIDVFKDWYGRDGHYYDDRR